MLGGNLGSLLYGDVSVMLPGLHCSSEDRVEYHMVGKKAQIGFLAMMTQSADFGVGFLKYNGCVTKQQQPGSSSCFYLLLSSFHK